MDGKYDDDMFFDSRFSSAYITKLKIIEACDSLCREMPYENIRVNDIARRAGISRTGFYYHFQDKAALVLWMSSQFYAQGLDETGRTLTWFEGHLVTTQLFKRFDALFTSAIADRSYRGGQSYYVRHRQENLIDTLVNYQHKELTDLLRFQIEALPYAEMTMANKYMEGKGPDSSIAEYCTMAASLVPRELHDALAKPVNPLPEGNAILLNRPNKNASSRESER